jgi:DNA invertase Pin-like site-specific DNA recombinase
MKIGYARVSTEEQTVGLQMDALQKAGCEAIYEEQASGKNTDHPQLSACLKALREGDTLSAWRLDRLGRNLANLIQVVNELEQRRIAFESLTERIETNSPAGKLIFHVFAALAEFERNLIRERTLAGLRAARARGRQGGRPVKLTDRDKRMIEVLAGTGELTIADIAAQFRVSRSTVYSRIRGSDPPSS